MYKVLCVVGSRPNLVKVAPLIRELEERSTIETLLVHTGQHYDNRLSGSFFRDLDIRPPDLNLKVGSGTHAHQTAEIMKRFEQPCLDFKPDIVIVFGDVNSTVAAALTAVKLQIEVAHIEAGLRSFDRSMPEEINRIVTDAISSLHFVTEPSAIENLEREGVEEDKIHYVGNLMIESLVRFQEKSRLSDVLERLNLTQNQFGVLTLHRPSNVDSRDTLLRILEAMRQISQEIIIILPAHPRTKSQIESYGLMHLFSDRLEHRALRKSNGLYLTPPLTYLDFLRLLQDSTLVLTDSGGIQEETTFLGVPCLTLRENTERPITITHGTNRLVGTDPERITKEARKVLAGDRPSKKPIPLWDDQVAQRISSALLSHAEI